MVSVQIIETAIVDWRREKKNLINVSKFQIVRLQTEWKHTGRQENYWSRQEKKKLD